MRAILIAVLTVLATSAMAQPVVSIDTELTKGRCRFIATDGEVGDYAMKRCPGLAGWRIYSEAKLRTVSLQFRKGNGKLVEAASNDTIGTKLEWRGTRDRKGFTPHAVIVQLVVKEYSNQADVLAGHNVLGVLRMEPKNVCLMAVIDEAANPDALTLARTAADKDAPALSCNNLKPGIVGAETAWAKQAIGSDEEPGKESR
jgi:hypothetical protein